MVAKRRLRLSGDAVEKLAPDETLIGFFDM
jgi:hypothetical protein